MGPSSFVFIALLTVHATSVEDTKETRDRLAAKLHLAARAGDEEATRILLKAGADPDALTKRAPGTHQGLPKATRH